MSHLRSVTTQLKDTECLVAALQAMGFAPELYGHASSMGTPQQLIKNYYHYSGTPAQKGDAMGDIIVRRSQHQSLDDLGFTWNGESYDFSMADGYHFKCRIDGSDRLLSTVDFKAALFSQYSHHLAHKMARSVNGTVSIKTLADGRRQYAIAPGAAKQVQQLGGRR